MFFNLAWRNSKRSRNENLIYFLTMVTAVAAFYIVLSLGAQDVIRFLSSLESDAVERLLTNLDRKSTRLNSSHANESRMPSSA